MKLLLIPFLLFLYLTTPASAQYPFEKFKKINFKNILFKSDSISSETFRYSAQVNQYSVVLQEINGREGTGISIYKSGKLLQEFTEDIGMLKIVLAEDLQAGDINGDGYQDIKIRMYNNGSGLAGSYETKIYLFGSSTGFTKLSFMDYFSFTEVDLDGDGNYEIIGCNLVNYKNHNYWTFDLYNYVAGKFLNVGCKYQYPIMIQYLNRDNYEITRKISRAKMKEFSSKQPGDGWK